MMKLVLYYRQPYYFYLGHSQPSSEAKRWIQFGRFSLIKLFMFDYVIFRPYRQGSILIFNLKCVWSYGSSQEEFPFHEPQWFDRNSCSYIDLCRNLDMSSARVYRVMTRVINFRYKVLNSQRSQINTRLFEKEIYRGENRTQ